MQEYLNQLSTELIYDKNEIKDNVLYIHCHMVKDKNYHVHSYFVRKVNDINYGNYKTVLLIKSCKYFEDRKASNRIFVIQPDFIDGRSNRTKRLTDIILKQSKETSAIGLERIMKNVAKVSDTTILRIIKKKIK